MNKAIFHYMDGVYDTALERSLGFREVRATLAKLENELGGPAPYLAAISANESRRANGVPSKVARFANDMEARRIDTGYDADPSDDGPWKPSLAKVLRET